MSTFGSSAERDKVTGNYRVPNAVLTSKTLHKKTGPPKGEPVKESKIRTNY